MATCPGKHSLSHSCRGPRVQRPPHPGSGLGPWLQGHVQGSGVRLGGCRLTHWLQARYRCDHHFCLPPRPPTSRPFCCEGATRE